MFTDAHVSDPSEDDSRAHQSLASVMNDPSRGRGFWETLRESVEELSQTREDASSCMDAATLARIEALIGTVPETADFQQYVNSFHFSGTIIVRIIVPKMVRQCTVDAGAWKQLRLAKFTVLCHDSTFGRTLSWNNIKYFDSQFKCP